MRLNETLTAKFQHLYTERRFQKAGLTIVGWVQPTDIKSWITVGCTHPTNSMMATSHARRVCATHRSQGLVHWCATLRSGAEGAAHLYLLLD